jgi:hypothetical protein
MGKVIQPDKKNPVINDVKVLDPTPIWIGTTKDTNIKRMMTANEAEKWVKEDPHNRKLTAYTTAGKLRQVD